MTDRERLLKAILAHPEEDAPRLMFADEIEADEPDRAEFVRVGCELARTPETVEVVREYPLAEVGATPSRFVFDGIPANTTYRVVVTDGETVSATWEEPNPRHAELQARERELFAAHAYHWLPEVPGLRRYSLAKKFESGYVSVGYQRDAPLFDGDRIVPRPPLLEVGFRRGFVEAVTCGGDDWARHGDAILAAHPVRKVTFTDCGPAVEHRDDYRQYLSVRWPQIPPEGWTFAPPAFDESRHPRGEDGRFAPPLHIT